MKKIGILHPGEMGISVAASAMNSGHQVYWVSTGRSEQTRQRAEKQTLVELQSLSELCQICEIILSICPPHAAEELARSVITEKYRGIYVDANAISPQRVKRLHQIMEENGIHFIDGSIIGGPAWKPNETFLYLSGKDAEDISGCFLSGPLETRIIAGEVGRASALKMCYAAYSKGTTALLASILATAEAFNVRDDLYRQWDLDDLDFSEQVNRRVIRTTPKAWRFTGEMKEIAATFENAGLPSGFHEAAAEVYHRMTNLKNMPAVTLEEIIKAITHQSH
jgi:3-hydroxyisobutyrate dehydrogenase-like beta-hydroxyacid dehydrogenase